jgi:hypothetical protein
MKFVNLSILSGCASRLLYRLRGAEYTTSPKIYQIFTSVLRATYFKHEYI